MVLTNQDNGGDVSLTKGYAHDLTLITQIGSSAIYNLSSHDITIVDAYGVLTKHKPRKMGGRLREAMCISSQFRGVVIVEKRYMTNDDLFLTNDYIDRHREDGKMSSRTEKIHSKLLNVDLGVSMEYYYFIHTIQSARLIAEHSFFIRGLNIVVSIPGKEKKSPLIIQEELSSISSSDTDGDSLTHRLEYHSNRGDSIYVNMLNTSYKLDAISETELDEGVYTVVVFNGLSTKELVPESDYARRGIYKSLLESDKAMELNDLLDKRRVDLEYLKLEQSIVETKIKSKIDMKRLEYDTNKILLDTVLYRYKRLELLKGNKAKDNKNCKGEDLWSSIKRVLDVIITAKKII